MSNRNINIDKYNEEMFCPTKTFLFLWIITSLIMLCVGLEILYSIFNAGFNFDDVSIIMLIFWQKLNKWNVTQVDIMSCAYGLKRVKLLFCPYFGKNKYKLLEK